MPHAVFERVQGAKSARPVGGQNCACLHHRQPVTIPASWRRTGSPQDPTVFASAPSGLCATMVGEQEIIGDQTEATRLLADAYAETRRLGRHDVRPEFAQVTVTLDRLRGTLGQLTHWDIRPARTVSLLASLAGFLTGPYSDRRRPRTIL